MTALSTLRALPGEVSAWFPIRQRLVAANFGFSSPDTGTLT